jgi:hypothetical protein
MRVLTSFSRRQTAAALRAEGKVESTSSEARDFCAAVLGGDWSKVRSTIRTSSLDCWIVQGFGSVTDSCGVENG